MQEGKTLFFGFFLIFLLRNLTSGHKQVQIHRRNRCAADAFRRARSGGRQGNGMPRSMISRGSGKRAGRSRDWARRRRDSGQASAIFCGKTGQESKDVIHPRFTESQKTDRFDFSDFPISGSGKPFAGQKNAGSVFSPPALPVLKRGAFASNDGGDRPFRMFPVHFSIYFFQR